MKISGSIKSILFLFIILMGSDLHPLTLVEKQTNKIGISIVCPEEKPEFYIIFSSEPLADENGLLKNHISRVELKSMLYSRKFTNKLAVHVSGKSIQKNYVEYFFGNKEDADMPWNNGKDFDAEKWKYFTPDIWNNIAVVYSPPANAVRSNPVYINDVRIIKTGEKLLDTFIKKSYANKIPIKTELPEINLLSDGTDFPLLNLSGIAMNFKTGYYELSNKILKDAYSQLGQWDGDKFTRSGNQWCSEFTVYMYRINGLMAPNPFYQDVGPTLLKKFFSNNGRIYYMSDMINWSDEQKREKIKPGAIIRRSGHTLLFTAWSEEKNMPLNKYSSISGNNSYGGIHSHSLQSLPDKKSIEMLNGKELDKYNDEHFFGVVEEKPARGEFNISGRVISYENEKMPHSLNFYAAAADAAGRSYTVPLVIKKGTGITEFSIQVPKGEYTIYTWSWDEKFIDSVYYSKNSFTINENKADKLAVAANAENIDLYLIPQKIMPQKSKPYKIRNIQNGLFLYEKDGKAASGKIPDEWIVEYKSSFLARIRNKKTGHYMHIQNQKEYVQCDETVKDGWWSAQWNLDAVSKNRFVISNRWKQGNIINLKGNKGFAEHKKPELDESAEWVFE